MSDQPKTWAEMNNIEKGALLLAHHEGKTIQVYAYQGVWESCPIPKWMMRNAYRVKPERKRETVALKI